MSKITERLVLFALSSAHNLINTLVKNDNLLKNSAPGHSNLFSGGVLEKCVQPCGSAHHKNCNATHGINLGFFNVNAIRPEPNNGSIK
jgi:hypothetical protein